MTTDNYVDHNYLYYRAIMRLAMSLSSIGLITEQEALR